MAFDFGQIQQSKEQAHKKVMRQCIDTYRKNKMDEWLSNVVAKSPDDNIISKYTFEGDGVCLWLGISTPTKYTHDSIIELVINGLSFQTCPFPISGIKKTDEFPEPCILHIKNIINGPAQQWERQHTKNWMMSDDWADNFTDNADFSDFTKIQLTTSFASTYALKQIVKKLSSASIEISSKSGILITTPLKRTLYIDMNRYKTMHIRNAAEIFSNRVIIK